MRQRVSFGAKERRRDQRRSVSVDGSIGGVRVGLIDLSLTGVGCGTVALEAAAGLELEVGQDTTLECTGPNGRQVTLSVRIQRIDAAAGEIGATFAELSDEDFDVIEKLMFPRRANAKANE